MTEDTKKADTTVTVPTTTEENTAPAVSAEDGEDKGPSKRELRRLKREEANREKKLKAQQAKEEKEVCIYYVCFNVYIIYISVLT